MGASYAVLLSSSLGQTEIKTMETPKSQEELNESIAFIRELLEKQKVVENMVHTHDSRQHELVESLVHRQHLTSLQSKLKRLHTADVADILERLPLEDRLLVWDQVKEKRGGEVLLEVTDAVRQQLVSSMDSEALLAVLNQMDGDDLAFIADDIPDPVLQIRLQSLTEEDQHWLRNAMIYEEDTAGYLMSNELVMVRDTDTLQQAASYMRSLQEIPIHNDKLFVVDRFGILQGVLPLQSILIHNPAVTVGEVMAKEVVKFFTEDDADEVAQAFERYDLVSAPVINDRGKLIGRLTVDIVMDYLREENTEDVLGMAGVSSEEDMFSSVWSSARNRGFWLAINLVTAFFVSRVIGAFEGSIAQLVALAALMPIVASVGGNIGNQTAVLIIRGMSLGQITPDILPYLLRKELGVSTLNGIALGLGVGIFTLLLYSDIGLAIVIASAMLLTLVLSALVGLAVPILLDKSGRDPALGSTVLLTSATDSLGFFIFLGLATVFLM
jgi:magnesium transporter